MWLAYSHFGFSTIGSGAATVACIGILGSFTLILAFLLAVESYQVPCEACLAVSLWTRGWTPVSMEWFGADSGATWALGAKNLYVWQKPFHGWGNPELRVIRYDSIKLIADPMASRNFVYLSLDFDLPQPRTEWIRFPVSSNGMDGEQLAGDIVARASLRGKDVQLLKPQKEEHRAEQSDVITLSPRVQPHASCWKLIH
jgi:hypothetical protein